MISITSPCKLYHEVEFTSGSGTATCTLLIYNGSTVHGVRYTYRGETVWTVREGLGLNRWLLHWSQAAADNEQALFAIKPAEVVDKRARLALRQVMFP